MYADPNNNASSSHVNRGGGGGGILRGSNAFGGVAAGSPSPSPISRRGESAATDYSSFSPAPAADASMAGQGGADDDDDFSLDLTGLGGSQKQQRQENRNSGGMHISASSPMAASGDVSRGMMPSTTSTNGGGVVGGGRGGGLATARTGQQQQQNAVSGGNGNVESDLDIDDSDAGSDGDSSDHNAFEDVDDGRGPFQGVGIGGAAVGRAAASVSDYNGRSHLSAASPSPSSSPNQHQNHHQRLAGYQPSAYHFSPDEMVARDDADGDNDDGDYFSANPPTINDPEQMEALREAVKKQQERTNLNKVGSGTTPRSGGGAAKQSAITSTSSSSSSTSSSDDDDDSLLGSPHHGKKKKSHSPLRGGHLPHASIQRGPLLPPSSATDGGFSAFCEEGDDGMMLGGDDDDDSLLGSLSPTRRGNGGARVEKIAKSYNSVPLAAPLPEYLKACNNYRGDEDDDDNENDGEDNDASGSGSDDDGMGTQLAGGGRKARSNSLHLRHNHNRRQQQAAKRPLLEHPMTILLKHNVEHCPPFAVYSNVPEVTQAAASMERRGHSDSTYTLNHLAAARSQGGLYDSAGGGATASTTSKGAWVKNFYVDVCFTKQTTTYTTDSMDVRAQKLRNVWVENERGWPGYDYSRCVADGLIFRNRSNLPIKKNSDGSSVSSTTHASSSASVSVRKGGGAKGADGKEALSGSVITNSRDTLLPLIAITYLYGVDEKIPVTMLTGEATKVKPPKTSGGSKQQQEENEKKSTTMLASERGRDMFTYINKGDRNGGSVRCDGPARSIGVFPNNRMCTSHLHEALVGGVGESTMPAVSVPMVPANTFSSRGPSAAPRPAVKPRHFIALRYLPSLCRAEDLIANDASNTINFSQQQEESGGSGSGNGTSAADAALGIGSTTASDLEESRTFFGQYFRPQNPTALKKVLHPSAAKNLSNPPNGSNGNGNGATLQDPASNGVRSLASAHRRSAHPFYKMRQVLGFDVSCMLTHATNMNAPDPVDEEQLLLIECPSRSAKEFLLAKIQRALVSFYGAMRRFHAVNVDRNPNPFATSSAAAAAAAAATASFNASSFGSRRHASMMGGGGGVLQAPRLHMDDEGGGGGDDDLNNTQRSNTSASGRTNSHLPPAVPRLRFGSSSPNPSGGVGGGRQRGLSFTPLHNNSSSNTHHHNEPTVYTGAGYGVIDEDVCLEACLQRTFHMHYMRRLFFHCANKNRNAFINAVSTITQGKGLGIRRAGEPAHDASIAAGAASSLSYSGSPLSARGSSGGGGGGKSHSIAAQTAAAAAAAAAAREQQLAAQAAMTADPKRLKAIDSIDASKDDELAILQKLLKSPPTKDSGIEGVFNYLMLKARTFVSLKKRRFTAESFNLDLAYVRPDIIAMGYPSVGKEALYRNPMQETIRFLETFHNASGASYPVTLTSLMLGLEIVHGASGVPTSCPYNPLLETFAVQQNHSNHHGSSPHTAAPYGYGVLCPLTRGASSMAGLDNERDTMRSCALMLPYPSASQRANEAAAAAGGSAAIVDAAGNATGGDAAAAGDAGSKKKKSKGSGSEGGGGGGLSSLFASKTVQAWQDEYRRRVLDTYHSIERFMYHDTVAVARALCNDHVPNYRIFNLCSERCYAPSRFAGSFERFPADDHHPAPFNTLLSFCVSAASYLAGGDGTCVPVADLESVLPSGMPSSVRQMNSKGGHGNNAAVAALSRVGGAISGALSTLSTFSSLLSGKHGHLQFMPVDPFLVDASALQRVVAIHCKAGKGRTGVMCVALMLFLGQFERGAGTQQQHQPTTTPRGGGGGRGGGGSSLNNTMNGSPNNNANGTAAANDNSHHHHHGNHHSSPLFDNRIHPLFRALNWYGITRTHNNKGVSIASQLQFLEYLNWYLESERHRLATLFATSQHPDDVALVDAYPKLACPVNFPIHYVPQLLRPPPCPTALLRSVSFTPYPCVDLDGKCKPYFIILCRRPNHTHYPLGQQEHVSVEADTLRPIYDSRLGWLAQRPNLRNEVTPGGGGGGSGGGGRKSGVQQPVRVVEKSTVSAMDSNATFASHQRNGAAAAVADASSGGGGNTMNTVLPPGVDPSTTAYFPMRGFEVVGEVRFVFYAEQRSNSLLFGTTAEVGGGGGASPAKKKPSSSSSAADGNSQQQQPTGKKAKTKDQYLFSFWMHTGFLQQQARATRIEAYTPEGKFSHTSADNRKSGAAAAAAANDHHTDTQSHRSGSVGTSAQQQQTHSPNGNGRGGGGGGMGSVGGLPRLSRFAHLEDSIDCPDLHATVRPGSGGVVRLRKEQLDGASKKTSKLFDSGFTCSIEFTLL